MTMTTTTTTTTTIITGGPTRFHPHGDTQRHDQSARAMPEFRSRFPVLGPPNPSYPALCRQATSYACRNRLRRIPLGRSEGARGEVRESNARRSVAALGGQNPSGAGLPGIPGRAWRPRWLEGRPKGGTEGTDEARHTLRTVCSGGQGPKK